MPKPIQRPDESLELAHQYGIKGKLPLSLDEVVVPVHVLYQPGGLKRTLAPPVLDVPCAGMAFVPPTAGPPPHFVAVGLENWAGSGQLVLLEWLSVASNDFVIVRVEEGLAPVGAPIQGHRRDRRGTPIPRAAGRIIAYSDPALLPLGFDTERIVPVAASGDTTQRYTMEYVLPPDARLWVVNPTAGNGIHVSFQWREVPLSDV